MLALSGAAGYHLLVLVNALSFFLTAILLLCSKRVRHHVHTKHVQAGGYRVVMQDRPFLILTLVNVVFAMGSMLLAIGMPLYLVTSLKAPVWMVGAIFALNTILLTLLQTIILLKLEIYRRTRVIILAGILWGVWCLFCIFALAISPTLLVPYLLGITCLYTLAELIHGPTTSALIAAISPDALRGRYLALFQFSWSVASILTPGLFTLLFTANTSLPWLATAILMVLACLSVYLVERHLPAQVLRTRSIKLD